VEKLQDVKKNPLLEHPIAFPGCPFQACAQTASRQNITPPPQKKGRSQQEERKFFTFKTHNQCLTPRGRGALRARRTLPLP